MTTIFINSVERESEKAILLNVMYHSMQTHQSLEAFGFQKVLLIASTAAPQKSKTGSSQKQNKATHFTATQCVLKKDFKNIYIL